jgi:hypothetical protein
MWLNSLDRVYFFTGNGLKVVNFRKDYVNRPFDCTRKIKKEWETNGKFKPLGPEFLGRWIDEM